MRRKLQYLVKWRGYPDPIWEPENFLTEVQAVDVFHTRYPAKPRPLELASTKSASQELSHEGSELLSGVDPRWVMAGDSDCEYEVSWGSTLGGRVWRRG